MSAQFKSFDDIWKELEGGCDRLYKETVMGMDGRYYIPGVTRAQYTHLYTLVHNYCSQGIDRGHPTTKETYLAGNDLYTSLTRYLEHHLSSVKEESEKHSNEMLLTFYLNQWEVYTNGTRVMNNIFNYLNRYWVMRRKEDDRTGEIYNLDTLALVCWRKYLFEFIHKRIVDALLMLIEAERDGEPMELSLKKNIVSSFVSLGLNTSNEDKQNFEIYQEYFQKPFVAATEAYYKVESAKFISENSVSDYMIKAEKRLAREDELVTNHLHISTRKVLIGTCERVLVKEHSEILCNDFLNLLNMDKQADLHRMYILLARVPDGLDPLREKFESHVTKAGEDAIEKIASDTEPVDPKTYVDALLEVHGKYNDLVANAFEGEPGFVASLDKACKSFVNKNKVCKSSNSKSPELLARFCDSLLKKNAKNPEEGELEDVLVNVMKVFKYVEDKDVFQKFYSKMLAKRLVNDTFTSEGAEEIMISRLKEACGFDYTSKLQRMLTDMSLSKELNEEFSKDNTDVDGDFKILVLGAGSWPLSTPTTQFNLPEAVVQMYDSFQKFYHNKHSGRKLNWLFQLSKAELKTHYLNSKTAHSFQVSTFQMGILLQYNTETSYTYEELKKNTALEDGPLNLALQVLVKAKVLLGDGQKIGNKDAVFSLNFDFKNKKVRVNLNKQIATEQKEERNETHKNIEEDRRYMMQAAIVRIMKTRKSMKHNTLIEEVITQLQSRFKPRIPDIKKCIDLLLEKEYIERHEGQKDMYDYMA